MPKSTKKVIPASEADRTVIYPKIEVQMCLGNGSGKHLKIGDGALTADQAKDLLGWQEEGETKFKDNYLLMDTAKLKVRCGNNQHNRPFSEETAKQYAQDILKRNWADSRNGDDQTVNGETIIIGKTGEVISGQHRLIGLIFAAQIWGDPEQHDHWTQYWEDEPTMECIIVRGVSESQKVVRTIDNVRPREVSDVFYTMGMFKKQGKSQRDKLTRTLAHAVRLLWERTGTKNDPYSPYLSNSEAVDFVERHGRLPRAVSHVMTEDEATDNKKAISNFIGLGTAAGLCYLMGAAASDGKAYREANPPTEKLLDFTFKVQSNVKNTPPIEIFDKATAFWSGLSAWPEFKAIREVFAELTNESTGEKPSVAVRKAVLIKAWNEWWQGKKLTHELIRPIFDNKEDGTPFLNETPTIGGIDVVGNMEVEEGPTENDPTPEELEELAMAERKARLEKDQAKFKEAEEKAKAKKAKKSSAAATEPAANATSGTSKK